MALTAALRRAGVRTLGRVLALAAVLLTGMVALGLVVTRVAEDRWPLTEEDDVSAALVRARTPTWDAVTAAVSWSANTGTIVVATLLVVLGLRRWLGRWREGLFVATAVLVQAGVFLATTAVVDRRRPAVPLLDVAPPTSSFPSGHTGAATALAGALAVVVLARRWPGPARALAVGVLLVLPVTVAAARLYRGMHHPSDVLASFANGALSVRVAARSVLDSRRDCAHDHQRGPRPGAGPRLEGAA